MANSFTLTFSLSLSSLYFAFTYNNTYICTAYLINSQYSNEEYYNLSWGAADKDKTQTETVIDYFCDLWLHESIQSRTILHQEVLCALLNRTLQSCRHVICLLVAHLSRVIQQNKKLFLPLLVAANSNKQLLHQPTQHPPPQLQRLLFATSKCRWERALLTVPGQVSTGNQQ